MSDMPGTTGAEGVSVLFVCLGNICRSTMAEGVFSHKLQTTKDRPDIKVSRLDSCGTGAYHAGSSPDPRTTATLKKHGITSYRHAARKIRPNDFEEFDYILGMDDSNIEDLEDMRKNLVKKGKSDKDLTKPMFFGAFGGRKAKEEVVDPYYGENDGFDIAYEQMQRFSDGLLEEIERGARSSKA